MYFLLSDLDFPMLIDHQANKHTLNKNNKFIKNKKELFFKIAF